MPTDVPSSDSVWYPTEETKRVANWTQFLRATRTASYEDLCARASADPGWYWEEIIKWSGFRFMKPFSRILDLSNGLPGAKWCVDGTANLTETCLDRNVEQGRGLKTAIIWQAEDGSERAWSYDELLSATCRFAIALKKLGVRRGEVVALFMPMLPETAAALLAVARIGAIALPLFSAFAPRPIAARLNDAGSVAVICTAQRRVRGLQLLMKSVLDEALATAPTVRHVLVVGDAPPSMNPRRDRLLVQLMPDEEGPWSEPATELPCETPFLLAYTSGTTGKPKGIVHTHTGLPVKMVEDFLLGLDLKSSDRFLWSTDMGWLVGPLQVLAAGLAGATLIMAEGAPDFPGPDRLLRLIDRHKVSMWGLGLTFARRLRSLGNTFASQFDLSSLRIVPTSGEPWDVTSWSWVYNNLFRARCPILNFTGGTELGMIVCSNVLFPVKPASFHGALPGTSGLIVDPVTRKRVPPGVNGELVVTGPCIGLTKEIWKSPDRYAEYWQRIPGAYVQGDWSSYDSDGNIYIHGRSDDVIPVNGEQVGSMQIESVLMATGCISDVAVVVAPKAATGSSAIAVVAVANKLQETEQLRKALAAALSAAYGSAAAPGQIVLVCELPKTLNMKTMRRLIRAALRGEDPGDMDSLANEHAYLDLKSQLGRVQPNEASPLARDAESQHGETKSRFL